MFTKEESMRKLLQEPLIQFLLIALLLLGGERLINADDYANEQYSILIDDQVLLQFMQLQAKMFKPTQAKAALEAMSAEDRQRLVDDYARNEVLFREAMALNLNKNDQIIRRRLIQKMDYLAQGFYDEAEPLTEEDLRTYYAEHSEEYKKAASATFTHVFISADSRDVSQAKDIADALLKTLNAKQVPFENAPGYGVRFLYNRNYVNRDDDEIGSHFGDDFKETVFAFEVADNWQGPVQSSYGWHLVLLKKNTPAFIPKFEEISSAVFADVQRQQQRQTKREAVNKLMAKYKISDQGQQ
ncbi:MAG: peptidylprolyl isomerase [Porticoccaceae bacterium]|nr:peptidylprolyl isomerase [Porticoccaceae bacterium]